MIKNKHILVIGGAGFIGSNLIESLVSCNCVVSLDNYSTGSQANHINGARYVRGEAKNIAQYFTEVTFDIVFHFGEYSRVEQSLGELAKVLDYNLYSIAPVVEFAKLHSAKLIYSGSSTKFGDAGDNKHASPYAWSKSTNTEFVNNYARWYGLDYAIVYFYNAYGPREISEGGYATLIAKYTYLCNQGCASLPVVKPGNQVRNFTHVHDIVAALLLVAEQGEGDDYGIGADQSYTVLDVVMMLGKEVQWLPERVGNRQTSELKTERTKALGWRPRYILEEYLSELLVRING